MNIAGKLRHRINLQIVTESQDSLTGEVTRSWTTTHSNIPASIEALSVREFLQSRADQSQVTARVMIRRLAGLTASMRIVGTCTCHSGRIYNPQGWLEDNVSGLHYLTAPCTEGVNSG